jgi:hypothetical protein
VKLGSSAASFATAFVPTICTRRANAEISDFAAPFAALGRIDDESRQIWTGNVERIMEC